jgi:hypothetical protein
MTSLSTSIYIYYSTVQLPAAYFHMSTPVFIPILSFLARIPSGNISCVSDLLKAIWAISKENDLHLEDREVQLSQLSLRSLVSDHQQSAFQLRISCLQSSPVSLEPRDTFIDRVAQNAKLGWEDKGPEEQVQSKWSDPARVHVIIYIERGPGEHNPGNYPNTQLHLPVMRAAENLHSNMWGTKLSSVLDELTLHDHGPEHATSSWKCLRKEKLDLLKMKMFGYAENGLLIRTEYEDTIKELTSKQEKDDMCRGAVVTGQPGIGGSLHWNWHSANICRARENMLSLLPPALSTRRKGSCGLSIISAYHCISRRQCL